MGRHDQMEKGSRLELIHPDWLPPYHPCPENRYRGASLKRKRPPPLRQDHYDRAQGILLLQGPREAICDQQITPAYLKQGYFAHQKMPSFAGPL